MCMPQFQYFYAIMENQISDTESVNSSTGSAGNSTGRLKAPSYWSEEQSLKVL